MTSKMLIKHSFRGLVDRQTRACVLCIAALGGARLKERDRKWSERLYFPLGTEKNLLSYYKKNDVKWSDNALTKPVIRPVYFRLKNIDVAYNQRETTCIKQSVFLFCEIVGAFFLTAEILLRLTKYEIKLFSTITAYITFNYRHVVLSLGVQH